VILGQLDANFALAENRAGISSVGAVDLCGGDDDSRGGASGIRLIGAVVQLGDLLLACGGEHHLVHLVKNFLKGLVVLLALEGLKF